MNVQHYPNLGEVASAGADFVVECARAAINARGRFILALSGGSTPWPMLNCLAARELPWSRVHLVQVDERVAPDGHEDRNLTHIREQFVDRVTAPGPRVHGMPVNADSLEQGAREYADTLREIAGGPPVLDLVHLGLGDDGHTASLVPGDALLTERTAEVGFVDDYAGRARMTLTFPAINRARSILWLICGAGKRAMLERLIAGDPAIPAGQVSSRQATILTDITINESAPAAGEKSIC